MLVGWEWDEKVSCPEGIKRKISNYMRIQTLSSPRQGPRCRLPFVLLVTLVSSKGVPQLNGLRNVSTMPPHLAVKVIFSFLHAEDEGGLAEYL